MQVAMVASRFFADTREFVRVLAGLADCTLHLLKGDQDYASALRVLRDADRIWFEGVGPLLAEVVRRPAAEWLCRAHLRAGLDDLARLPVPDVWRLVGGLATDSPAAAERVRTDLAVPPHVHFHGPADLRQCLHLVAMPPAGLPARVWDSILRIRDTCRGRVRISGDAPHELHEYLHVACGLPEGTEGEADTGVFWQGLSTVGSQDCRIEYYTAPGAAASGPSAEAAPGAWDGLPLVSAVVPVYNGQDTLDRNLRSLLGQTYPNLEILVVDDGSTDGTAAVAEKHLNDPRVRYLYKAHSGRPETRNLGVQAARGEYIAWLDADDVAMPNRITVQVQAAQRVGGADVVHSDGLFLAPDGSVLACRRNRQFSVEDLPALLMAGFGGICPILNTSVLVRKDLYARLGPYDPEFLRCQDYDFWCRAAMAGHVRFVHVPARLVHVYRGPSDPAKLGSTLDAYHRLARKLIRHFGVDGLPDPVARDLHEPGVLTTGRCLLATGLAFGAPPDHAILAEAEVYLRQALREAQGPARDDAAGLLEALQEHRRGRVSPVSAAEAEAGVAVAER